MQKKIVNKYRTVKSRTRKAFTDLCRLPSLCKQARDGLDDLLSERLPAQGTYVEAGALDGFGFSNTYYLDRIKGWSGLLVEPNPMQFAECQRFRKRAHVVHCALVPFDYEHETISITYGHDLTWTNGAYEGDELFERQEMLKRHHLSGEQIEVPARTLQSLIDEFDLEITFFSLDVEGFELSVLQGLDFSRSAPRYLLIECQTINRYEEVQSLLGSRYAAGEKLSRHDYLFRLQD